MSKRVLSLLLAAVVLMGVWIPAYAAEETIAPEEMTVAEETAAPEQTTAPTETTAPEETTAPTETATPEQTAAPEQTTAPEQTAAPAEPVPTAEPGPVPGLSDGWHQQNGIWYYYSSGSPVTGWLWTGGAWYWLGSNGKMATGWVSVDGRLYYMDASGAMVTGWQLLMDRDGGGIHWYWFDSSGAMATGWNYVNGAWYWLEADGKMATGWKDVDGKRYYLYGSGAMVTGWEIIEGAWRYFNGSGAQLTGWQMIDGEQYYLDPNANGAMYTGWHDMDGHTYYFKDSGALAVRPTYMSDGQMYMFRADGSLQRGGTISRCNNTYTVDENGVIQGYVTAAGRKAVNVLNQVGWNLWAAYKWAAGLTYADRWYRQSSIEAYANRGFDQHNGNCFVMNSCLYQMIKMMGYDVWMTNGGVRNSSGGVAPHGWCEVYVDGAWYVFDSNFHNETGMNGYHISYGQSGTWQYVVYGYLR